MKPILSTIVVLVSLLAPPAYAQDVRAGIEAYERGDFETALREWQALAQRGDGDAQSSLGLLYALGQGVPQDFDEAVKWFRLSAEQGYAIGQNNLAAMYLNGRGVAQDYATAVKLYRLSAAQGYTVAQYSLGSMLENGFGVEQDYEGAYMWYSLAVEKGHKRATQALFSLESQLTVEQKNAALARLQEYQARDASASKRNPSVPAETVSRPKEAARAPHADASPAPSASISPREKVAAKTPATPTPPAVNSTPAKVSAKIPTPAHGTAEEPTAFTADAPWRIQLASLDKQSAVEAMWKRLQQANQDLLNGLTLHVQQAKLQKGTFYRVQAGPLADRATAASLCKSLKSRKQDCLIVAP